MMAHVRFLLGRVVEAGAPRHERIAHEVVGEHDGGAGLGVERFQRLERAVPRLGAEGRVAGNGLAAAQADLGGREPDAQALRKQT
jgi:hypothetical protein